MGRGGLSCCQVPAAWSLALRFGCVSGLTWPSRCLLPACGGASSFWPGRVVACGLLVAFPASVSLLSASLRGFAGVCVAAFSASCSLLSCCSSLDFAFARVSRRGVGAWWRCVCWAVLGSVSLFIPRCLSPVALLSSVCGGRRRALPGAALRFRPFLLCHSLARLLASCPRHGVCSVPFAIFSVASFRSGSVSGSRCVPLSGAPGALPLVSWAFQAGLAWSECLALCCFVSLLPVRLPFCFVLGFLPVLVPSGLGCLCCGFGVCLVYLLVSFLFPCLLCWCGSGAGSPLLVASLVPVLSMRAFVGFCRLACLFWYLRCSCPSRRTCVFRLLWGGSFASAPVRFGASSDLFHALVLPAGFGFGRSWLLWALSPVSASGSYRAVRLGFGWPSSQLLRLLPPAAE